MALLPKPSQCQGCPFYQDGTGFVPDDLIENAPVLVMAQNPGEDEEAGRAVVGYSGSSPLYEETPHAPLLGATGWAFRTTYAPLARLERGVNVSVGSVLRCRWQRSNELPPPKLTERAIVHCQSAYGRIPTGTKLIVAMGGPAMWAMSGVTRTHSGIDDWRGWLAPHRPPFMMGYEPHHSIWTPGPRDLPVLATHHLSYLWQNALMKIAARADWNKAARVLAGQWPSPLPPWNTMGEPGMWQHGSAFDTEFDPLTGTMNTYQLCTPSRKLYLIRAKHHDIDLVPKEPVRLVMQNAPADLAHATRLGLSVDDPDDIMLIHSVLWAGMPHDLNFTGSLYASLNRWKHLYRNNFEEYAAADAWGTLDVYEQLQRELENDPRAKHVYEQYVRGLSKLIAFRSGQARGLRVRQDRARAVADKLRAEMDELSVQAGAAVGYPLSLGAPAQVGFHLYSISKIKPPPRRRPKGKR